MKIEMKMSNLFVSLYLILNLMFFVDLLLNHFSSKIFSLFFVVVDHVESDPEELFEMIVKLDNLHREMDEAQQKIPTKYFQLDQYE